MQTIAYSNKQFFLFLGSPPGFLFTVTVTVSTTFLVTDSEGALVAVPEVFQTGSFVLLLSEEVPFVSVVQAA